MRYKKAREVNIFSASVVDIFASGLGVFLIVAIIALVNQKKETAKGYDAKKDQAQNLKIISELEAKVSMLSKKIIEKQEENMVLRTKGIKESEKELVDKLQIEAQIEKSNLEDKYQRIIKDQKEKIESLIAQFKATQQKIVDLKSNMTSLKSYYEESKEEGISKSATKTLEESSLDVGSKIKLHNVQFYAGTTKTIEPYASEEIKALGKLLLSRPTMRVEVSGHIFLSKEEIQKRTVFDSQNLSGRRANTVCKRLIDMGVASKRLKCVGYGGQRYLYLTNDEYSREAQLNRRVEVEILSK